MLLDKHFQNHTQLCCLPTVFDRTGMTRDQAILILMRTEGNSEMMGYGPTDDEVAEALITLGITWRDGKIVRE